MIHIKEIKTLLIQGNFEKAESALDHLLSLGPKNIEALSLKAKLYGQRGQYELEHQAWLQVLSIDPEDVEGLQHIENAWIEEREQFYFTDEIPYGGRRFIAHPRAMIHGSVIGICGCALYLLLSAYSTRFSLLSNALVSLFLFVGMVLTPWLFILMAYFKAPREIFVDQHGLSVHTRKKSYQVKWQDIKQISLVHDLLPQSHKLTLVLIPKDSAQSLLEIEMSPQRSIIKAKTCLLREIRKYFGEVNYLSQDQLEPQNRPSISF